MNKLAGIPAGQQQAIPGLVVYLNLETTLARPVLRSCQTWSAVPLSASQASPLASFSSAIFSCAARSLALKTSTSALYLIFKSSVACSALAFKLSISALHYFSSAARLSIYSSLVFIKFSLLLINTLWLNVVAPNAGGYCRYYRKAQFPPVYSIDDSKQSHYWPPDNHLHNLRLGFGRR